MACIVGVMYIAAVYNGKCDCRCNVVCGLILAFLALCDPNFVSDFILISSSSDSIFCVHFVLLY